MYVLVWKTERNHPPTPPLLKCVVLYFTEGRQVNEKLSILSPSPRRRAKATLILPNVVFTFFWRPVRSVVTPVLEGTGEERQEGYVRAVMPSVENKEKTMKVRGNRGRRSKLAQLRFPHSDKETWSSQVREHQNLVLLFFFFYQSNN